MQKEVTQRNGLVMRLRKSTAPLVCMPLYLEEPDGPSGVAGTGKSGTDKNGTVFEGNLILQ